MLTRHLFQHTLRIGTCQPLHVAMQIGLYHHPSNRRHSVWLEDAWRVVSEEPQLNQSGFLLIVRTEQIVTASNEASTVGYTGYSSI